MKVMTGAALLITFLSVGTGADSIQHGGTMVNMTFVDIGQSNVGADSTGYGTVDYAYRMGKYEVTASQWATVITADPDVGDSDDGSGSLPVRSATWNEAAKFANWLTSGNAYEGAYQFDGSGAMTNVNREAAVAAYSRVYVLPTEDEWYKAAYLKSDGSAFTLYPTGDSIPIERAGGENYNNKDGLWNVGSGSVENNGTFDMGGNQWEWTESAFDGVLDDMSEKRVIRGGEYINDAYYLSSVARLEYPITIGQGFRIVAIPILTDYQVWADSQGIYMNDAICTNDYDGDGLDNVTEWGFGGDPRNPSDATGRLPRYMVGADGNFLIIHPRPKNGPYPKYNIFSDTDLVNTPGFELEKLGNYAVTLGGQWDSGNWASNIESVTNVFPSTMSTKFFKLKVSE
ncbi:formylglycine-generating enzyme family protein [Pontiella agarivorans]|uniref:SUMF1/EgtB/PvdO family nonheme iron enzyme n=1 Tax=Pontiella agarivorans TaxID=3038953 RepID=A0ABU5N1B2_9BACT|nr:SUMF1/EgtB/PvdO family nonheme iron enzyme [Pontiella agarivorans]MDZ8120238.1 SUMF1/EgtB/PvdO family nonheme iron enzyme [Pontiella agarivorans]